MRERILPPTASSTGALSPITEEGGPLHVLVIEDDDAVRGVLVRFLTESGYDVEGAHVATMALALLTRQRFHLALCDVHMPGMSGVEFVKRALQTDPDLAIVMLTGANDAATATGALSAGALDYLTKPIDWMTLGQAIGRALHKRRLIMEQRRVERAIREEVAAQTLQLRNLTVNVVETLVNAMEARDLYLRGHSQRTAELGASIAEMLGLDADTVEQVRVAGRLHDVGKIGIPESVLNKPSSLTAEEFQRVKEHVRIGMEILAPLAYLGPVLDFVRHHHEHWDGTGYPSGLRGEQISVGGRILAAADAYDSLTSNRAYREPRSSEATMAYLAGHTGTLMDPRVYAAMRKVIGGRKSLTFIDETQV